MLYSSNGAYRNGVVCVVGMTTKGRRQTILTRTDRKQLCGTPHGFPIYIIVRYAVPRDLLPPDCASMDSLRPLSQQLPSKTTSQ